ncbi:hypothetical protein QT397_20575 [Microbulbifer sp. MKSA007]|uniref:Uncharacterized protein n=1 Tax=Microbulbifer variabilis TaxID=266805 RepID=A0ABY4V870_9GAMM|nr:hypothetical protein [Microbulbifer variabilis]USD20448.1 hypothetical protein MJO52_15390 [Microbulbifer variabilis]WNZ55234.1 hypothetical protein QT397_20575 [Microbulbifer sp. MKSA007]
MSNLKDRRWRRKGLDRKIETPSWGELAFGKKLFNLRHMLLAVFTSGFISFAMLYQLITYGHWEAKGAKVDGAVGYGVAFFLLVIFIALLIATIKDWRRG